MRSKLTRELVEFQSNRIEAILASHRIPVRVHGGVISPGWIRFHFTAAPSAKVSRIRNLAEEIALALGAATVRIARDGEMLAIEVPRTDKQPIHLLPLMRKVVSNSGIQPLTACIGLTQEGHPLLVRLPSPDVAHLLVAGTTGSGKTELIRSLLFSLAATNRQHKMQIALIDPKARGFAPLAFLPHLIAPIATDVASATQLLERLLAEMDQRDAQGISSPQILIAVDEVVDLLMTGGKRVETALTRIAQRGREAGLHLILGAQKPSAAVLGAQLKANLPLRLVGRVGSVEDARVATGVSSSGAEKLSGCGDFIAVSGGEVIHFQSACVSAEDLVQLRQLIQTRTPLLEEPLD